MAMATRVYRVILEWDPEAEAWAVSVPALPGCLTFGKTRQIAMERATEAVACHLEGLKADGLPFPEDVPAQVDLVEVRA